MFSIVVHSIACRDECRHIASSLLGKEFIYIPKIRIIDALIVSAHHGFVNIVDATVEGCNH